MATVRVAVMQYIYRESEYMQVKFTRNIFYGIDTVLCNNQPKYYKKPIH